MNGILINLSSNLETIDISDETKSSSNFDFGSTLSSSIAVTKSSSVENKNKSDKDIKTEMDNIFLNN
jgi:hypothetical protein